MERNAGVEGPGRRMRPLSKRAFLVGGHVTHFLGPKHPAFIHKKHPEFGIKENPDLRWYITESVTQALEATGCAAEAVDKLWIGNFCGELFNNQGHLGAALVGAHPGLLHKPSMRVEGACTYQSVSRP